MSDTLKKNLGLLNKWLASNDKHLVLHLIGGYALFLKGMVNRYTIDIDSVYAINDEEIVEELQRIAELEDCPGWFDLSALSLTLPENYELRLNKEKGYSNIEIYTLSKVDLVALKVAAYYIRKEMTQRDLADIFALKPNEQEIDFAFSFLSKTYGSELTGKFLKEFQEEIKSLRKEIEDGLKS